MDADTNTEPVNGIDTEGDDCKDNAGEIKDETAIRSAMEEVVEKKMARFLDGVVWCCTTNHVQLAQDN